MAAALEATGASVSAWLGRARPLTGEHLLELSTDYWDSAAADVRRRIAVLEPTPFPPAEPEWRQGPPAPRHTASPAAAAAFFAALSPPAQSALAERYPELVGPVDGAPLAVRYRANHLLAVAHLAKLERLRRATRGDFGPDWESFRWIGGHLDHQRPTDLEVDNARRWAEIGRQLLRFDTSGDGEIVEVLGDLETARHLAVLVPGVGNDLAGFEDGLRANATALLEGAGRADVAVVAWLGYDPPDDLLAATNRHPVAAARSLSSFLAGLGISVGQNIHMSIIGHSYGSLVTGRALQMGAVVDEVVFIGSPGVGVDHVSKLGLPATTRVWAGRAASDPIRFARAIECLEVIPVCYPSDDRLFFGVDPTDPDFGARRFPVEEEPVRDAHSAYFRRGSESLRSLTAILVGDQFSG